MCGMSQQHPVRSTPSRPARPDASMSLLTNVMEYSLDEGYAEAAARRSAQGRSGTPRALRARLWLAAGLVLTALVVTVGAAQARYEAPTEARERQGLIDRIEKGGQDADDLQRSVDDLRGEVAAMQREALRKHGGDRSELVALLAGAVPVEGPGIELVVDDAEDTGAGEGGGPRQSTGFADTGRVRDRDLQRVVNGLWESGAEAISVNGQRLTALSAIRAAGDAILVDNKPLVPPYTLLAVGDGERLSAAFQNSGDGRYLDALQDNYDIRTGISVKDRVRLPAAPGLTVRTAEPVKTGENSTS
ncbi:hypothetical protein CUT44_08935 [Streptomyces carminius]|uniref:DUF881 domain-containing protein n=1 Tax=Streptomyces carminius TaxID=2665496 RepID=A0A2M8M0T9_9ACTN|nr:DUF881 domain-containing protein [Streptomyces carminius]PJE97828.1 hypothetical protein CUT44_08935 [Streptomyces carminius]